MILFNFVIVFHLFCLLLSFLVNSCCRVRMSGHLSASVDVAPVCGDRRASPNLRSSSSWKLWKRSTTSKWFRAQSPTTWSRSGSITTRWVVREVTSAGSCRLAPPPLLLPPPPVMLLLASCRAGWADLKHARPQRWPAWLAPSRGEPATVGGFGLAAARRRVRLCGEEGARLS